MLRRGLLQRAEALTPRLSARTLPLPSQTSRSSQTLFLAAAVYPSPALQRKHSSSEWEGWHSGGSASPPHDLHVAQPLKHCSLWRGARSQSLQQFTLVFFSSPTPLLSLPVPLSLFLCHTQTHIKRKATCNLLTGSPLSIGVPHPPPSHFSC